MSLCLTPRIEGLARRITGREDSLFAGDMRVGTDLLAALVGGRRVLVAGGAGSIGASTVVEMLALRPAVLAVLDTSENNLAELLRTLRGRPGGCPAELLVEPLDYGSALAASWLAAQAPFDLVLNFAALKHVRSERDPWSLLRMLEVNLLKADRFLAVLRRQGHGRQGVFFVSTDKAADPVGLMGASKRAMELLLWAHAEAGAPASLLDGGEASPLPRTTTARFANVAFSDGSLPWAYLQRLEKQQPLAAPRDVRRYLVSPVEAGQLCLLAALLAPHRHVLIPRMLPERDAVDFASIATATLRAHGFEPRWCESEAEAQACLAGECAAGRWPVLLTRTDTSGEKDMEIFVAAGEQAVDCDLASCQAIPAPAVDRGAMSGLLALIADACAGRGAMPGKEDIAARLSAVVPELRHRDCGASLDAKA